MRKSMMLYSVLMISAAMPATAQTAAPGGDASADPSLVTGEGLEDLVVTARRREERMQSVPVAITAVTGEQLVKQGVDGLTDLRRVAPSLNITQSSGAGRNAPLFTIRGQRQGDVLSSLDPSVGMYMGDLLYKRTYGMEQTLFDLGSVEVLKGPQGTLFGQNVTGGNVILRPNRPTDQFEGGIGASVGNYDYRMVDAFLNVPLGAKAALRVAGQYKKRDGYIRNVVDGRRSQDEDGGGVRVSLLLDPTEDFTSLTVAHYIRRSVGGSGFKLQAIVPGSPAANVFGAAAVDAVRESQNLGYYQIASNVLSYSSTKPAWDIANTSEFMISDSVSLKNIIGYRKYRTNQFDDVDGSRLPISQSGISQRGDQFSEELQLLGETGSLNWIVGGYYLREHVRSYTDARTTLGSLHEGINNPANAFENVINTSKSLFGSGTFRFDGALDGLSATLGARYTWDTRYAQWGRVNAVGYVAGQPTPGGTPSPGARCAFAATVPGRSPFPDCTVNRSVDYGRATYTATIDYQINADKLIYVAHRKGYRAGGWNTRASQESQLVPFRPEEVLDYELGIKADWRIGDTFLRTNLAVYHQSYKDIQRLTPFVMASGNVSTNVLNAARASIDGGELEVTFKANQWLTVSGNAAYTKAKYKEFIIGSAAGPIDVSNVAAFGGVPKWQAGGTAEVALPLGKEVGQGSVLFSYYYQSAYIVQDRASFQPLGTTPSYDLVNARMQLSDVGGSNLSVALFVNNLLKNKYSVANFSLSSELGFASSVAGAPRMYGLEMRYRF